MVLTTAFAATNSSPFLVRTLLASPPSTLISFTHAFSNRSAPLSSQHALRAFTKLMQPPFGNGAPGFAGSCRPAVKYSSVAVPMVRGSIIISVHHRVNVTRACSLSNHSSTICCADEFSTRWNSRPSGLMLMTFIMAPYGGGGAWEPMPATDSMRVMYWLNSR